MEQYDDIIEKSGDQKAVLSIFEPMYHIIIFIIESHRAMCASLEYNVKQHTTT